MLCSEQGVGDHGSARNQIWGCCFVLLGFLWRGGIGKPERRVRMFSQSSQDGRRACLVLRWMREQILGASASLQHDAQLVFQKTGVGISCFASIQIISVVVAPA